MRWQPVVCALAGWELAAACGTRSEPAKREPPEGQPIAVVTDSARMEGVKLELLAMGKQCAIRFSNPAPEQLTMVPRPPCYFVRGNGPLPQTFSYPDVGVRWVLIVVGSAASDETRKRWNLTSAMVCGEEAQSVLLRREQIVTTNRVNRGGVTCRDAGVDEKEFWSFAHEEE